jgi:hypothetical protein
VAVGCLGEQVGGVVQHGGAGAAEPGTEGVAGRVAVGSQVQVHLGQLLPPVDHRPEIITRPELATASHRRGTRPGAPDPDRGDRGEAGGGWWRR